MPTPTRSRFTRIRFGKQLDMQGIIATEGDADRRVAYLTKYLAKSFGEAFGDQADAVDSASRPILLGCTDEVRWLAVLAAVLELAAVRRSARRRPSRDGSGCVPGEGSRS